MEKKIFYQKPRIKVRAVDCENLMAIVSDGRNDNPGATPGAKHQSLDDAFSGDDNSAKANSSIWDN